MRLEGGADALPLLDRNGLPHALDRDRCTRGGGVRTAENAPRSVIGFDVRSVWRCEDLRCADFDLRRWGRRRLRAGCQGHDEALTANSELISALDRRGVLDFQVGT